MKIRRVFLIVSLLCFVTGCVKESVTNRAASVDEEFASCYEDWQREREQNKHMSYHDNFTDMPAFCSLVALGTPALPLIRQKVEEEPNDLFLTYAIIEIKGWNPQCFESSTYEQVKDKVLRKLDSQ